MPLRRRLVLLTAGTVGGIVVLVSVVCYLAIRAELRSEADRALLEQAGSVRTASLGSGDPGRFGGRPPDGRGARDPRPAPRHDGPVPSGVLRPPAPGPGEQGVVLAQLIDPAGAVLRRTGDLELPVTAEDRAVASGEHAERFGDRHAGGVHLRVLTVHLPGRSAAVQLARSLEPADSTLGRLRLVLALLCLVGTAIAIVASRVLARRVVAPVTELTEAAEHISATEDLGRRLEARGDDEVGRMAQRFNAMLDRLQGSREALGASVAAQRQLVADASHELRTPVTSLRTNIEVLLGGGALTDDERRGLLDDVRDQVEELGLLINDVIELARGDKPLGDVEELRVDELVAEAVERAERHWPAVRFDVTLEPALLPCAPDRLGRAVGNLLANAAGHSPPGGVVEVALRGGELDVRDHGPGVADEDKPHVFDRFYRGATARSRPGSGLGLAIVRQTAEAHGGTVTVEDAPGGGALFRLRLPATPQPEPEPDAEPAGRRGA